MMENWQLINSLIYLICVVYVFKDISCFLHGAVFPPT